LLLQCLCNKFTESGVNGVVIDYGKDGKIVSIEILDASERTQKDPLGKLDFSVIRDAVAV